MESIKSITEFVVISNLENRALNAGISKAQNWWRQRHQPGEPHDQRPTPVPEATAKPSIGLSGQLTITVLRGKHLAESRLAMLKASSDRPYIVLEYNQQRFETERADSTSSSQDPQWSSNNGPFTFQIHNSHTDRLTLWVQQRDLLHLLKQNEPKLLGIGEINVQQLIGQTDVWIPLRKDNRPAGQVLVRIHFRSHEKSVSSSPPPPYGDNF